MKLKHLLILGLTLGVGISTSSARERTMGDVRAKLLEEFDANEDGELDEEERQAMRAALAERRDEKRAEFIAEHDTDGDGVLSPEEKRAAREAVREAQRQRIIEARTEKFNELAGDDGCISPEEFAAIPAFAERDPDRVAALFARMDADDSGDVKLEEFLARLQRPERPDRPDRPSRPERPERPERPDGGDGGE